MTIVDCTNKLYEWFCQNDTFFLSNVKEDDLQKLFLIVDDPHVLKMMVELSLEEMASIGLVKSKESHNGKFWFLTKPFSAYEQTIILDSTLCLSIASFINKFCEENKDLTDLCNSSRLTSKDIRNLLLLAIHYANQSSKSKIDNE